MALATGPTLRDVARLAGVSTATVSFVINDTKPVAAGTRARVEAAIAALGYRRSPSARALRTGRHHAIGLLLPDLINPFFPALAQAVTEAAWARGHALILAGGGGGQAEETEALAALSERADGIIWIPGSPDPMGRPSVPAVILDRPSASLGAFDSISADHHAGGVAAARLLRRLGRRRIGLLAGPGDSPSAAGRRDGFLAAIDAADLLWQCEAPFALDLPEAVAARLRDPALDAVFAASDVMAIGVLRRLRDQGVAVPEDVAVIGFDDIPWAALVEPPLTTIRQPVAELGDRAVATLIARLGDPDRKLVHEILPVSLVERASTFQREAIVDARRR